MSQDCITDEASTITNTNSSSTTSRLNEVIESCLNISNESISTNDFGENESADLIEIVEHESAISYDDEKDNVDMDHAVEKDRATADDDAKIGSARSVVELNSRASVGDAVESKSSAAVTADDKVKNDDTSAQTVVKSNLSAGKETDDASVQEESEYGHACVCFVSLYPLTLLIH